MIQNPSIAKVSAYVKSLLLLFISIISYSNTYSQKQIVSPVYKSVSANIKAYYESLPVDYAANPSKKYPLIIFLHGVGELGAGTSATLPKVKANSGLAKLIDKGGFPTKFTVGGKDYSFIVIAPQFSTQSNYTQSIDDLLAHVKAKYRVDVNRIYLTGLSMGGGMAHDYGSQRASTIAAILPICPAFSPTQAKAEAMANAKLPVWITVNSGDSKQYPTNAKDAIAKLKALYTTSNTPWITVFDKSGHDAWTKTYDPTFKQGGYNVYEWMLLHSRSITSSPVVTIPPPIANAGSNQTITLPASTVTLNGSASKAGAGSTIKFYSWSKVSGPAGDAIASSSSAKTTVSGLTTAGTYVFELRVRDDNNVLATDQVSVTVKAALPQPTANAGSNQTITLPVSSATLDGSSSKAVSGSTIKFYNWSKISGPAGGTIASSSSAKTMVSGLTTAGTYVFELRVRDDNNVLATDQVSVTVKTALPQPTANAGSNQTITLPVSSATLDGSSSKAVSGATIKFYNWSKVSGPAGGAIASSSSAKTTVSGLTTAGTYVFELRVRDNNNVLATDRVSVTVKAALPQPTANAGSNQTITLPVSSATLDGSSSKAVSGATIKFYNWSKISGPAGGAIASSSSAKTTVSGLTTTGTYVFELRVRDNNNVLATDRVSVTVKAATSSRKTGEETADVEKENPAVTAPVNDLEVKINPNPVTTSMNVWVDSKLTGKTSVQVYSITGVLLMQKEFTKGTPGLINQAFDVSSLPRGIYVVYVTLDGKQKKAVQIIKQ